MVTIRDVFARVFGKNRELDYEYESITVGAYYSNKTEDEEFQCVSNLRETNVNGCKMVEFDVLCDGYWYHIDKSGRLLESVKKGVKSKAKSNCYKYGKRSAVEEIRISMAFCSFTIKETRGCLTIIDTTDGEIEGKIYLNTDLNRIIIYPGIEHCVFEKMATNMRDFGYDVEVEKAWEGYRK